MRPAYFTPVRRNHIIGPSGVGSLLVSRSGVTVLMTGLPEWVETAPAAGADEAARRLDRDRLLHVQELHDENLERDLGVRRLISPPVVDDDVRHGLTWFVPAVRFPRWEHCTNGGCRRLVQASAEDPSVGKCPHCADTNRKRRTQQVPLVLICGHGHLDEIDWVSFTHRDGPCGDPRLTYKATTAITTPTVKCETCQAERKVEFGEEMPCTGARPWLPHAGPQHCDGTMRAVDRTSTQTYYPEIRSVLHIPAGQGLRDAVLRWLQDDRAAAALRRVPSDASLRELHALALPLFPDLTLDALRDHVVHLDADTPTSYGDGRLRELEALTSGVRGVRTIDGPPILDAEVIPAGQYAPDHVGPGTPISGVVAVHRLAETRALAGFARVIPPLRTASGPGRYPLMWGHEQGENPAHDWLPGMRVYGEGLLLELDPERVHRWAIQADPLLPTRHVQGVTLTAEFQLAHTLAHLLMNAAAVRCGYPIASLRDRIYADASGRTALLIYTGEGDVLGTMGGLVELAQPDDLEQLLDTAYANARWCGLDPVCLQPVEHVKRSSAGACHQCCLLPETSCDWWNKGLDRATLIGRDTLVGYLDVP